MNLTDIVFITSAIIMWYITYYIYNIKYEEINIEKIAHDLVMIQGIIISSILTGISTNIIVHEVQEAREA